MWIIRSFPWLVPLLCCLFLSVCSQHREQDVSNPFVAFLLRMSPWLPISFKIKAKVTALTCKALYHLPLVVFLTAFSFSLKTYTSSFQESIQHDMIPSQCLCTGHSLRLYTPPQRATWLAPSHLSHFCVKKAFMDNLSKITVTHTHTRPRTKWKKKSALHNRPQSKGTWKDFDISDSVWPKLPNYSDGGCLIPLTCPGALM